MNNRNKMLLASLALASAAVANTAQAGDALPVLDDASLRIGWVVSNFDTNLQANGSLGNGSDIDMDKDLNLDQSNGVAFVSGTWRPFKNHEFSLGYFSNSTDGTRKITRDIIFDGVTYPVDSTVKADFNVDVYELSYTWWGMQKEDWALGLRLGLVDYSIDTSITLLLDSAGNEVTNTVSNSVSPNVPAPAIGASWRWRVADQWRLKAEAGYFSADVSGVDGSITYFNAGAEWFPWERWGFSATYTYQSIDVSVDKSKFNGNLDLTSGVASIGLTYRF